MNHLENIRQHPSASPSRSNSLNRIPLNKNEDDTKLERISLTSLNQNNHVALDIFDSPEELINVNLNNYQQKKSLAQGMLDLALLSANANQLRYVLESLNTHPYSYVSLVFIMLSIVFQIAVGVGLVLDSRYNINITKEAKTANKNNNMITIGILLITIINIIVPSFSVAERN